MKKHTYLAFSILFVLFLTACGERTSSKEPQPEPSSGGPSAPVSESAPQESAAAYQTYQVPVFGIEFDCPADFGGEVKSNVMSDSRVIFSLSTEDRVIMLSCMGVAALNEDVQLAQAVGGDSAGMVEDFKSLDVAAAIDSWKELGYETFELLDSFSTPDSYGFYYIGKDSFGDAAGRELCYRYKNYGGFWDAEGVVRVDLDILGPESVDREEFVALCEAVTSSLRMSDAGAEGAPSEPGSGKPAMEALSGGNYEEQCGEIVGKFFRYAELKSQNGSAPDLMRLMDGNADLIQELEEPGMVLCGSYSFSSALFVEDCGQSGAAEDQYYVNVIETRAYDEWEMGMVEYGYTFYVTIHSPTDYCITGVDSEFHEHWDNSSIPADGEYDDFLDGTSDSSQDNLDELAMQRAYGANAQMDDHTFYTAFWGITYGDGQLAFNPYGAYELYSDACEWLEDRGYMDTPLYDLALCRLALAQEYVDIETEKRTSP